MKQLTVLVAPINGVGHVNACVGATEILLKRGHRVVFVVESSWKGKLAAQGFEERLYYVPSQEGKNTEELAKSLAKMLQDLGMWSPITPKEKCENLVKFFESPYQREEHAQYNQALSDAIKQLKPDLIFVDENGLMPAIYYSGIPWIRNFSANPLFFFMDKDLPPGGSGLPLDDRSKWDDFNSIRDPFFHSKGFNDFVKSLGYPRYPQEQKVPPSQILITYACPEEWNYPALQGRPGWFNLEVFNKNESKELVDLRKLLPKEFLADSLNGNYSGKLIYLSMGSMGSIDIDLMKRLVAVLGKTNHKYIISKGPLHDQYKLERNQWGARFLPQTKLIPQVDLVITHGGNNSVTEIFAQGKPMLVLPLYCDQYDNAQRLQETGHADRVDPYNFEDQEIIDKIDKLLNDDKMKQKLEAASKRIQITDRHTQFAELIEQFVGKKLIFVLKILSNWFFLCNDKDTLLLIKHFICSIAVFPCKFASSIKLYA